MFRYYISFKISPKTGLSIFCNTKKAKFCELKCIISNFQLQKYLNLCDTNVKNVWGEEIIEICLLHRYLEKSCLTQYSMFIVSENQNSFKFPYHKNGMS